MNQTKVYSYQSNATPAQASVQTDTQPSFGQPMRPTPSANIPNVPNTPPPPPAYQTDSNPIKSNLPKIIFIGLAVVFVFFIISRFPRNFDTCARFPGSNTANSVCTTFYGKKFVQNPYNSLENGEAANPTIAPNPSSGPNLNPKISPLPTQAGQTGTNNQTTKGGQPVTSPTPTKAAGPNPTAAPQPTHQPTPTMPAQPGDSPTAPAGWTKHNFPAQHISLYLPADWTASNAVRNVNTQVHVFTIATPSQNPVMEVKVQPNWNNTGNVQSQAVNFTVDGGVNAIKVDEANKSTYYFQHGNVYIVTCFHNGNSQIKDTCEQSLKTLKFI